MDDVRIVDDPRQASEDAKELFLSMLEMHGLTVLPKYLLKWWKYCG